jgi:hypothetical protein
MDRDDGPDGAGDGVSPHAFPQAVQGVLAKLAPNAPLRRPVEKDDARPAGLVLGAAEIHDALDCTGVDGPLLYASARIAV